MPSATTASHVGTDRRAARRAARRTENRTEILDAAERVFGREGLRDGSLREIAAESGFSTAAIYLFFENKQALASETLARRGDELISEIRAATATDGSPIEKLHLIVDVTVRFFAERPDFRLLLRHVRGGMTITGPVLGDYESDGTGRFDDVMAVLAAVVLEGQEVGEVRDGDARAIAHLYSVLINEFVILAASDPEHTAALTRAQFHGLIDGALRP